MEALVKCFAKMLTHNFTLNSISFYDFETIINGGRLSQKDEIVKFIIENHFHSENEIGKSFPLSCINCIVFSPLEVREIWK